MDESVEVEVAVDAGPEADQEELERLGQSLRAEILELDVDAVDPAVAGPAPDDARAIEALALGALVVRLVRNPEGLSSLVRTVRAWLGDRPDRRVRVELDGDVLELVGPTDAERQRVIDAWIERHARA